MDESTIDGVLHYHNDLTNLWIPHTLQALTTALRAERGRAQDLERKLIDARRTLGGIKDYADEYNSRNNLKTHL